MDTTFTPSTDQDRQFFSWLGANINGFVALSELLDEDAALREEDMKYLEPEGGFDYQLHDHAAGLVVQIITDLAKRLYTLSHEDEIAAESADPLDELVSLLSGKDRVDYRWIPDGQYTGLEHDVETNAIELLKTLSFAEITDMLKRIADREKAISYATLAYGDVRAIIKGVLS